jgi:hypothetical protein
MNGADKLFRRVVIGTLTLPQQAKGNQNIYFFFNLMEWLSFRRIFDRC